MSEDNSISQTETTSEARARFERMNPTVEISNTELADLRRDQRLLGMNERAWKWAKSQLELAYDKKEHKNRFVHGMIKAIDLEIYKAAMEATE